MCDDIMKNLYKMQQNREGTDCCFGFEVKSEDSDMESETPPETRLVYAHKLVLTAASPVFKTMLSEKWSKDDKIIMHEVAFETFEALIKAIYTKCFEFSELDEILNVLSLAYMYKIDYVITQASTYLLKLYNRKQLDTFSILNYVCVYNNLQLKESCLHRIKLYTTYFLGHSSFLEADVEVVNLIFALDELTIQSETVLMDALEKYIEAYPETKSELQQAINNIRFLTMTDQDIMRCKFLDVKTKNRLVLLKNHSELPSFDLLNYSRKREPRPQYKIISALPVNVVAKLYEIFNTTLCFLCKTKHNSLICKTVLTIYKSFSVLRKIYAESYSHTCLDRYSNNHIMAILKALREDEYMKKLFGDLLDLPILI